MTAQWKIDFYTYTIPAVCVCIRSAIIQHIFICLHVQLKFQLKKHREFHSELNLFRI